MPPCIQYLRKKKKKLRHLFKRNSRLHIQAALAAIQLVAPSLLKEPRVEKRLQQSSFNSDGETDWRVALETLDGTRALKQTQTTWTLSVLCSSSGRLPADDSVSVFGFPETLVRVCLLDVANLNPHSISVFFKVISSFKWLLHISESPWIFSWSRVLFLLSPSCSFFADILKMFTVKLFYGPYAELGCIRNLENDCIFRRWVKWTKRRHMLKIMPRAKFDVLLFVFGSSLLLGDCGHARGIGS